MDVLVVTLLADSTALLKSIHSQEMTIPDTIAAATRIAEMLGTYYKLVASLQTESEPLKTHLQTQVTGFHAFRGSLSDLIAHIYIYREVPAPDRS